MTNKKIVGLALAAVLLPAVASAATIEELQAQINALMAQLSAAKPATTASCSVVLSKTLKMGMSDAEVMDLQKALNSDVATQVAASGVGSKGNETSYFGAATKAAVVKFQNKYASEVLAPAGLSTGTGLVGAATRAKINALCSATVTTPTTTTTTPVVVNGGAGSASVTSYTSDNDTNVVTGVAQTVLGFKVKADGSDVAVSHVKLTLTQTASGSMSNYLDRYFSSFEVYANGSKVATVSAADFNRDSSGVYSKTLALDKVVVKMGASNQTTFTVKAIGSSSIDSANAAGRWTMAASSLRYSDGTGVVLSEGTTVTVTNIQVNKLATSSDVKVKFSSGAANPDVKTVFISDTASGDKVVMNEFKIKAEGTKISFDQLKATTTSSTTTGQMITELQLVKNGSVIDTVDPAGTEFAANVATFNIDNLITIAQDETATFQIVAKMQKIDTATFPQGETATVSFSTINAQDANGDVISATKFSGSANGKTQTFRATGLNVAKLSSTNTVSNNSTTASSSYAEFKMQVKVTASGDDIWVPLNAAVASTSVGFNVAVLASDGSTTGVVAPSVSVSHISGGTKETNAVKIADGESATFELVVVENPSAAGQYRLQLNGVNYAFSDSAVAGAGLTISASPVSDFQSSLSYIQD